MLKRNVEVLVILLLVALTACTLASPYQVIVKTNKSEYSPGEEVTVSVTITPSATVVLLWEVYDPNGVRKDFGQLTCSGTCSFKFRTGSNWPLGSYRIIVAVSGTPDKGSATFTLRTPTAPPSPPSPPSPPDYKRLAELKIAALSAALTDLNATLSKLLNLLIFLNQTLSRDYLVSLNELASALSKAIDLYNQGDYENAYKTAVAASQVAENLSSSVVNEVAHALTSVAKSLGLRAQDDVALELIKEIEASLANLPSSISEAFSKLLAAARILVVAARALRAPQLEASVAALTQQVAQLQSSLESLNETRLELQAQLEALQQRSAELASSIEVLRGNVTRLLTEKEQLNAKIKDVEEENAKLKAQLEQSVPQSVAIAFAAAAALVGIGAGAAISARMPRKHAK